MSASNEPEVTVSLENVKGHFVVDTELHQGFQLGSLVVEPDLGIVIRNGQRYHLAPKAMEVLLFLSSTNGEIVSREEILAFAWGDNHAAKTNVTHVISEIRHVLDDHKECPTYIQTIPRKGYRMLLPTVAKSSNSIWPFPADQLNQISGPDKKWKLSFSLLKSSRLINASAAYLVVSWVLLQVFSIVLPIFDVPTWGGKVAALGLVIGFPIVISFQWFKEFKTRKKFAYENNKQHRFVYRQFAIDSFFVLIILFFIYYISTHLIEKIETESTMEPVQLTLENKAPISNVTENSVAVLPYYSSDTDNNPQYFVSGLQEELINLLALKPVFKVSSIRAINALEPEASIDQIKNILGVKYIVEGRSKTVDGSLIINTTMTDVVTGFQVWSDESKGSSNELVILFSDLSRKITNALHLLVVGDQSVNNNNYMPTDNFAAYDAYLQGKEKYRNSKNINALVEAETLFIVALQLDPDFIQASSALCQTYLDKYLLNNDTNEYDKALNVCQLIASNETVSFESELALGTLYRVNGQYEKSETHLNKAKLIKPESSEVYISLAVLYAKLEQSDEAENLYQQAISLELGNWRNYYDYGVFLYASGRYEQAVSQFNKVTLINKNSAMAYNALGAVYYMVLNFEQANIAWSKSLAIEPTSVVFMNLGSVLFFMKRFENAAEMYLQSAELSPLSPTVWGNLGDAFKYSKNKAQSAKSAYEKGLNLAKKNAVINDKNPSFQAQISRYYSELNQCEQAKAHQGKVLKNNVQDPYIYYDLAIVAINCFDVNDTKLFIEKAIVLGYPAKLLLADPQFYDYKDWLKEIV
ncbi:winged helix-turn-helix domain-containing protein [Colwellia sp. BRX10-3]|uniref:winged helix-turn-helix domain-containing protein n=1 Tax=Colwellia sp. BRX10-3 TaxID=2759844 RepID=UPI0015F4F920|nr:winged helix-turn-helix domain-containing protein [Colwellia sp. BRX10-3]MBA6392237.1 winged helix-turn-helix domain-containing protein [Colwellia sp. BRX10-3]